MIEVLPDMPDGVSGIRVSGRIGKADLREFMPTIQRLMDTNEIRFVEVIDSDYEGFGPGAFLEDLKMGFGSLLRHHGAFRRTAVVTDKEWIGHALHALAWMVPGEVKLFGLGDLEDAKTWAAG